MVTRQHCRYGHTVGMVTRQHCRYGHTASVPRMTHTLCTEADRQTDRRTEGQTDMCCRLATQASHMRFWRAQGSLPTSISKGVVLLHTVYRHDINIHKTTRVVVLELKTSHSNKSEESKLILKNLSVHTQGRSTVQWVFHVGSIYGKLSWWVV